MSIGNTGSERTSRQAKGACFPGQTGFVRSQLLTKTVKAVLTSTMVVGGTVRPIIREQGATSSMVTVG